MSNEQPPGGWPNHDNDPHRESGQPGFGDASAQGPQLGPPSNPGFTPQPPPQQPYPTQQFPQQPPQPGYGQAPGPYGQPPYGPPAQGPVYGGQPGQPGMPGVPPQGPPPGYGPPPQGPYGPGYQQGQPGQQWAPYGDQIAQGGPRRRRGVIAIAAVVVAVLGIGGGAYAVFGTSSDDSSTATGGAKHIPNDAVGIVNINFDAGDDQEAAAVSFFRSIPDAPQGRGDTIIDGIITPLIQGTPAHETFEKDVKPWLGSRISVAADPQGGDEPVGVVVADVTDEAKARQGLDRTKQNTTDFGYVIRDGFVVISESDSAATKAADDAAKGSLADVGQYTGDLESAGVDDALINGWVDVARVKKFLPDAQTGGMDLSQLKGRLAFGLLFGPNYGELVAKSFGNPQESVKVGSDVAKLPDDTAAAVSVGGLDQVVEQIFTTIEDTSPGVFNDFEFETGLDLPDDITALVGDKTTVAVQTTDDPEQPEVGLITSGDPGEAADAWQKIIDLVDPGSEVTTKEDGDRTVLATSEDYANQVVQGGSFGSQDVVKTAAPDLQNASFVLVADIEKLTSNLPEGVPAQVKWLKAFGVTASVDGDTASMRMRLVVNK